MGWTDSENRESLAELSPERRKELELALAIKAMLRELPQIDDGTFHPATLAFLEAQRRRKRRRKAQGDVE